MDPHSEIGKRFHLFFGISLLSSNDGNDCFIEDLMSNLSLSE